MKAVNITLTNGFRLRLQIIQHSEKGALLSAAPCGTDGLTSDYALVICSEEVALSGADDPNRDKFLLYIGETTLECLKDLNDGLVDLVDHFLALRQSSKSPGESA